MSFALIDIEQAFLQRLQPALNLAVELYPARSQDYRLLHPKGAVLIVYAGSEFSSPEAMGAIVQTRVVKVALVLMVRNLRTHADGLPWLDALRALVTGFTPVPGATKAYPQQERFLNEQEGVWSWELMVHFKLPNLELDDGDLGVLLRHITTLDGMEQVDVEKTDNVITITETPRDSEICVDTE